MYYVHMDSFGIRARSWHITFCSVSSHISNLQSTTHTNIRMWVLIVDVQKLIDNKKLLF